MKLLEYYSSLNGPLKEKLVHQLKWYFEAYNNRYVDQCVCVRVCIEYSVYLHTCTKYMYFECAIFYFNKGCHANVFVIL